MEPSLIEAILQHQIYENRINDLKKNRFHAIEIFSFTTPKTWMVMFTHTDHNVVILGDITKYKAQKIARELNKVLNANKKT